jgi:predicted Zn-dependent protease
MRGARPAWLAWLGRIGLAGGLMLAGGSLSQAQLPAVPMQASAPVSALRASQLPSLGDGSEFPAASERRLGDRIALSIYRDPDYLDDPVLADYVQGIWQPLMDAARVRGELSNELEERFAWTVMLVRDRSVNAFALPGGYMGVHTGLIAVVASADELAAVMGHELSHVTQRHISRLMTQQQRQMPWVIGAMIIGALAASKSPTAANAAIVGGQAVAAQGQLNFSRDMEREADRVGFGVMVDAGFDANGVGGMFEKLQQASRLNDNGSFPYLRSHPLTTQRIAEARARIQTAPPHAPHAAPGQTFLHGMMAARARVLGDPGVDTLRLMVDEGRRTLMATAPSAFTAAAGLSPAQAASLYGGAFAASRLREHALASSLAARLKTLVASLPGAVSASSAAGLLAVELDFEAGQLAEAAALTRFDAATSRSELLVQARVLLAVGRAAEVSDRLQTWVVTHPKDALAWQLLADAWGRQNQLSRAVRAEAESRFAQLDHPAALDRLRAAQELLRSGRGGTGQNMHIEASIIDTRTRQVAALIREQALEDKLDRKLQP